MKYYLSLGSNLGSREENIARALWRLSRNGVRILKSSSLYETEPVDLPLQPWFINQVVEVEGKMKPKKMLNLLKSIEKEIGRTTTERKGPRIIDIDILIAGKTRIKIPGLEIPHPRMEKRSFVLEPFAEISPGTMHPLLQKSIEILKKESQDSSIVRIIKGHSSQRLQCFPKSSPTVSSKLLGKE